MFKHPAITGFARTIAAVGLVAGGMGLTLLLWPWTKQSLGIIPLASVALAAWWTGLIPGIVAALTATVAIEYFCHRPYHQFTLSVDDALRLIITTSIAVMVAYLARRERIAVHATEQARRHLDLLTDSLPVLIGYVDRDLRFQFNNKAYADWFGVTKGSLRGRTMREVVGEEAYEQLRPQIEAVLAGNLVSFEQEVRSPTGEPRVVLATLVPETDEDGDVLGFAVMVADVSERRRAEAALRASEEKFHVMADSAPVMVWIADEERRRTWVNKPWLEFTGRTMEQELDEGWSEIIHPEDRHRCLESSSAAMQERRDFTIEYRVRRHDGQWRWLLCNGRPLFDADGRFNGYVGSCIDITERKEHEEEREHLLASERHARGEAERVSRLKDDFLATLSHELRTPLAPVLLTVSMLESHPALPPELREEVDSIRRNVELEAQLIADLLDLTRISKGMLQLEAQEVDLHAVARSAIDICQRDGSAQLVVDLSARCPFVRGDPTRLQQIFWNLISNAQKFTGPGGMIRIASRDLPDGRIGVSVTDTGVGIDAAVLPRLFSAFEQGEVRASRQQAGLGLGLAISRRLAEAHGGTVRAESPGRGKGSTFTVELPAIAPAPRHRPEPEAVAAAGGDGRATPLHVLLIEDHEPTLRIMTRLLRRLGHDVAPAASVSAALEAARHRSFDLVISDLGLPDGSGLDVMRRLRAHHVGPAIALSGYGMQSDVDASHDAGFTEHLIKPINLRQLEDAIRRVTAEGAMEGE